MYSTYICLYSREWYSTNLWQLRCLLPGFTCVCFLFASTYYLIEQSQQCVLGSFTPAHDVFLLLLNTITEVAWQFLMENHSSDRERKGCLKNGICSYDVWVPTCGWGWPDSAEWNRRLMTHPVFFIYELRFDHEVWVSCHHHHILQLGEKKRV